MDNAIKASPTVFLASLTALLSDIEAWIASDSRGLSVKKSQRPLNEEEYGIYSAPQFVILNVTGDEIAQVIPVAASVLGANGRVDIKGRYDTVTLLDFDKGGPQISDLGAGDLTKPLYRGIDEAGWYWLEHTLSSKGRKLTRELFFEILEDVCEYAY